MAIAVDQNYDKAQRKISTANLEQFAGVDCQLLVEKETHRPIIMDGATVGGKFKCASTDELKAVETVANNAISQATADSLYLKKEETAKLAERATSDANGNVITDTYATKTELSSGLESKQPAGNYALKSELQWDTISGKPSFATVATTGNYNDLVNKPSIPASPKAYITNTWHSGNNWYRVWSDGFIEQGSKFTKTSDKLVVTFPKAFVSPPLSIAFSQSDQASGRVGRIAFVANPTKTNMTVYCNTSSMIQYGAYWYACGY